MRSRKVAISAYHFTFRNLSLNSLQAVTFSVIVGNVKFFVPKVIELHHIVRVPNPAVGARNILDLNEVIANLLPLACRSFSNCCKMFRFVARFGVPSIPIITAHVLAEGVEPSYLLCRSRVLPLNYTSIGAGEFVDLYWLASPLPPIVAIPYVENTGIEPVIDTCKVSVLPLHQFPNVRTSREI